jgi:hypothetical protein
MLNHRFQKECEGGVSFSRRLGDPLGKRCADVIIPKSGVLEKAAEECGRCI